LGRFAADERCQTPRSSGVAKTEWNVSCVATHKNNGSSRFDWDDLSAALLAQRVAVAIATTTAGDPANSQAVPAERKSPNAHLAVDGADAFGDRQRGGESSIRGER
jgi:hypothetical protein